MAIIPYDFIDQDIVSTELINPLDMDSFYNPTTQGHTGFAADGIHYTAGVQDPGPIFASWYTEYDPNTFNPYRGNQAAFPAAGLILLSKVSLTILNETENTIPLWMQFLLNDEFMLANNFNQGLDGWTPNGLSYADGIVSVLYTPDAGNVTIVSPMIVSIDFGQDLAYLDVAT
jgi:hypothetical protein